MKKTLLIKVTLKGDKMQKKVYLGLVCMVFFLASVLIGSGIGFAQGSPPWASASEGDMAKEFIKADDADGDGKVSSDEFKGPDSMFESLDKNADGFIELSEGPTPEFMQGMGPMGNAQPEAEGRSGEPREPGNSPHVGEGLTGQAFIDFMDTDKDGKVTHTEWEENKNYSSYVDKHWPDYNQNNDEYITLDEAPQKGVNWEPAPELEGKTESDTKASGPNTNQIAFIAKFDTNQDGKVDNTEFTGVHFPVYDANSDGFIEPLEAPEGETAY